MVRLFDLMKEDMRYVVWKKNKKLFQESAVDATDDDSALFPLCCCIFIGTFMGMVDCFL